MNRFNKLPDELLIAILSSLPTKAAIETALLSRSWRYLWTKITALRFSKVNFSSPKSYTIILDTIKRVSSTKIQTIKLSIELLDTPVINTSIDNLIIDIVSDCPNVKELNIKTKVLDPYQVEVNLPRCVFGLQSLEILEMKGFRLSIDGVNYKLPNLRKLVISFDAHDYQHSLNDLVKSCPLLEILSVKAIYSTEFMDPFYIKAQNLLSLSINLKGIHCSYVDNIAIDAPKLQYLEVNSGSMVKIRFIKAPSHLAKAKVFMGDDELCRLDNLHPKQGLLEFVNQIYRIRALSLHGDIVLALSFLESNVEMFNELINLELGWNCSWSWKGVERLLHKCPNLRSLVLRREHGTRYYTNWSELDHDHYIKPYCFMSKLERIEMWHFNGSELEVERVISYIIKVAKDLKMFHIFNNVDDHIECLNHGEDVIHPQLRKLKKMLPSCQIKIPV